MATAITKWDAPANLAKVYSAAADAIDQYGHSIGKLRDPQSGGMCLWGAISFVLCGQPLDAPQNDSLRYLDPLIEFTKTGPVVWNNKPTRTKRQVVNLLRRAAKAWRGRR